MGTCTGDLDGRVLFPRPPVVGESLRQHLHRVRRACSYEAERWWRDLVPPRAASADLLRTEEHVRALASALGQTPREVIDMTLHRFVPAYYPPDALGDMPAMRVDDGPPVPLWQPKGVAVYAHGMSGRAAGKVCPLCRGTRRTILLPWSLRQVTTCPIHLVRLVDRCQGCGLPLEMDIETGTCLHCGRDAATFEAETIATDPDSVALTAAVWGALGFGAIAGPSTRPVGAGAHPLAHMRPHALLLYLWESGPLLARRDPSHPLYDKGMKSLLNLHSSNARVAHELLLGAWRLLDDWPRRLDAALARIAARECARGVRASSFPRMLFAHLPPGHPAFAWLHEAFADFVHAHLGRSPGVTAWYVVYCDVLQKAGGARPSLLTRREAAASLGIGLVRLQRYIDVGAIEVRHLTGGGTFPACVVDSREVERLARVRGTPLTLEGAAAYLGVGRDMVRVLAKAGLIRVAQLRAVDGTTDTIYRADLLDYSLADLLGRLPIRPFPAGADSQALRLREIQSLLREQGGRLPELLHAVRDGALVTFRATHDSLDLADLWWDRPDIVRYLRTQLPEEDVAYYGERQVALLLGVPRRVLYRWRDAGLLLPAVVLEGECGTPARHKVEPVYDRGAVDAFRARYATLTEAAALVGVARQTLQQWADRGQVPGARAHYVPYHGGILYDRRSIAEFKATRVTADEAGMLLGISPRTFGNWVKAGRIKPVCEGVARQRLYDRVEVLRLKTPPRRVHELLLDELMAARDAANYLGITHRHFNRLVTRGDIRPAVDDAYMGRRYAQVDVIRLARVIGLVTADDPPHSA